MGQPQTLLTLGPFTAIDTSSAGPYVKPTYGISGPNANPHSHPLALQAESGRVNLTSFSAYASVSAIAPYVATPADEQIYAAVVRNNGATNRKVYDPLANTTTALMFNTDPDTSKFDQAVQVGSVLYDNAGRQYSVLNPANTYTHQYPPFTANGPPNVLGGVNNIGGYTITTSGNNAGFNPATWAGVTLFFTFTRLVFGPNGAFAQESSVPKFQSGSGPDQYPSFIPYTFGASPTFWPQINGPVAGTNADGTTWFTNVYLSNSLNPVFYFLVTLTGAVGLTTPYIVAPQNPNSLSGNAQPTLTRDQPPSVGTPGAAMAYHKSRVWEFTIQPVTTYPTQNNVNVSGAPPIGLVTQQMQLWWSKFGIPWEFDSANQVALVDAIVPANTPATPSQYGEQPVALASLSSVLLAWTTSQCVVVYGDGTTASPFILRKIFNIGCRARRSVAVATLDQVGTVAIWLSENGVEMTDGQYAYRIDEDIKSTIGALSFSDRQNAVAWFAHHTYYISFPQLNQTFGFYLPTQTWFGPLQYSTTFAFAVQSDAKTEQGTNGVNEVIAVRPGTNSIDQWFAGGDLDLGAVQNVSWVSPLSTCGDPQRKKNFDSLTVNALPQPGITAVVTVATETESVTKTLDLSKAPATTTLGSPAGGPLLGFFCQVSIAFTTSLVTAQQPAQIFTVGINGTLEDLAPYDDGAWS